MDIARGLFNDQHPTTSPKTYLEKYTKLMKMTKFFDGCV